MLATWTLDHPSPATPSHPYTLEPFHRHARACAAAMLVTCTHADKVDHPHTKTRTYTPIHTHIHTHTHPRAHTHTNPEHTCRACKLAPWPRGRATRTSNGESTRPATIINNRNRNDAAHTYILKTCLSENTFCCRRKFLNKIPKTFSPIQKTMIFKLPS